MKLSRVYYKQNNEYLLNLIPCYRKSDDKPGMYDTISGTFYTNSGTGEFILGPEAHPHLIDWSEDIGTVYGGYVDLISGELVQTWRKTTALELPAPNVFTDKGNGNYDVGFGNGGADSQYVSSAICSIMKKGSSAVVGEFSLDYVLSGQANRFHALIHSDETLTSSNVRSYLDSLGFEYARIRKTPITHQLAQSQLTILTGNNTFWSNADSIEIEYDLIETQEMMNIRKRIMGSFPHTESINGESVSFNTDMKAPLKECKVYFNPVQDLHGYSIPWIGGSRKNLLDIS